MNVASQDGTSPQDAEQTRLIVAQKFNLGQRYVESGQYLQAIPLLSQAAVMAGESSKWGGEIQLWLLTAYDAAGQQDDALKLCRKLKLHPAWEIRKQSKRLLYILEAPKLTLHPEWMTKIPDLEALEGDRAVKGGQRSHSQSVTQSQGYQILSDHAEDWDVEPKDNGFTLFAIILLATLSLGLLYFA